MIRTDSNTKMAKKKRADRDPAPVPEYNLVDLPSDNDDGDE